MPILKAHSVGVRVVGWTGVQWPCRSGAHTSWGAASLFPGTTTALDIRQSVRPEGVSSPLLRQRFKTAHHNSCDRRSR